jgi:hypothetical protein
MLHCGNSDKMDDRVRQNGEIKAPGFSCRLSLPRFCECFQMLAQWEPKSSNACCCDSPVKRNFCF